MLETNGTKKYILEENSACSSPYLRPELHNNNNKRNNNIIQCILIFIFYLGTNTIDVTQDRGFGKTFMYSAVCSSCAGIIPRVCECVLMCNTRVICLPIGYIFNMPTAAIIIARAL